MILTPGGIRILLYSGMRTLLYSGMRTLLYSGMRTLLYSRMRTLLYSFEKFEAAIELEVYRRLLPHPHPHAPMEESMSAADVPLGTLQFSSSMPSIDELLR